MLQHRGLTSVETFLGLALSANWTVTTDGEGMTDEWDAAGDDHDDDERLKPSVID